MISSIGGDKSISQLQTLPIKERQIFTARMLLVYFLTFLEVLYCLLPTIFFLVHDFGIGTLVPSLIATMLCPILPMSLALLVIMPVARVLVHSPLKKVIQLALNLVFILAYFFFVTSASKLEYAADSIADLMSHQFSSMFPPAIYAGEFMLGNWGKGLVLIVGSLLLGAFVVWICGFFARVVLTTPENHATKKGRAVLQAKPIFSRLLGRQLTVILSSQRFILGTFFNVLVIPILLLIYHFAGIVTLDKIQKFIALTGAGKWLLFGVFLSCATFSNIGASSVAREGKTFWQNKIMPISARKQLFARLLFTLLVTLPVAFVTTLCLGIAIGLSAVEIAVGILLALGYVLFYISIDHFCDVRFPNINWTHENQAVKNSTALTVATLSKMFMTFAIIFASYFVERYTAINISVIVMVLGLLLAPASLWVLFTKGAELYNRIEA